MIKSLITLLALWFLVGCTATKSVVKAEDSVMLTQIDLVNIDEDRALVTIDPGAFTQDEISFYIPKTVPGTYSIDDYGQYIEGFKALDYEGNELSVSKPDINTWQISDASKLDKVTYYVNDTYDLENSGNDVVFSPAGTNIDAGENYMLNLHGFVGYFTRLKEVPYEISIMVPEGMVATTSLQRKPETAVVGKEIFIADRYFEVIDNPIMYARPNNTSFQISDITVNIGVYSPNDIYKAEDFKDDMEAMMKAQKAFLGEINSTEEYNIILYLSTMDDTDAMGFGALEHHTSTVVVFPEQMPRESLGEFMVDVVSHEFFHIVTPLNVHSQEIHYFDYNDPKMSQHLWMYEGTTEYFANLFQIQQGLIDEEEFFGRMMGKMENSYIYDDSMSFTTMSSNILEDPYKDNYANVYEKGTLINMCIDIMLRDLSDGERGVLWLMKELTSKYDSETPFEDQALIPEIVGMTYPEIGAFFTTHVQGDTPIDYDDFLTMAGLTTAEAEEESGYFFMGDIPYIDVNPADNSIFVRGGIELSSFFQGLGIQGGDTILSINGIQVNLETIRPIIGESFGWDPDRDINMVVLRNNEEVQCEGKAGKPTVKVRSLRKLSDSTEEQSRLLQAWLKG